MPKVKEEKIWNNADLQEIELFNMSKKDLIEIILDCQDEKRDHKKRG